MISPSRNASLQSICTHESGFVYSDTCAMSRLPTNWATVPEARRPPPSSNTLKVNSSSISSAWVRGFSDLSRNPVGLDVGNVAIDTNLKRCIDHTQCYL